MKYQHSSRLRPPGLIVALSVGALLGTSVERCDAKVDTGADLSGIPMDVVTKLALPAVSSVRVRGVLDATPRAVPVYYVRISIDNSRWFDLKVFARPRATAILGGDLLNQLVLHADGPAGMFELITP